MTCNINLFLDFYYRVYFYYWAMLGTSTVLPIYNLDFGNSITTSLKNLNENIVS